MQTLQGNSSGLAHKLSQIYLSNKLSASGYFFITLYPWGQCGGTGLGVGLGETGVGGGY